jgi:hypothetical protein
VTPRRNLVIPMRLLSTLLLSLALVSQLPAALTTDQKVQDFEQLASLYAKYYGPIDWKQQTERFDGRDTSRWLERVRASRNDLEFIDICYDYVSSFNDGHVTLSIPSNFTASIPFTTDIYDGKVLIDSITRSQLPLARFPFEIGDEVVSIDGQTAEQWIQRLSKYEASGNTRTTRRSAADSLTFRSQRFYPFAHLVGDTATVVIKRNSTGQDETYTIPWTKAGTPLLEFGLTQPVRDMLEPSKVKGSETAVEGKVDDWKSMHRSMHEDLLDGRIDTDRFGILNYGARAPIFRMPTTFVQRLGRVSTDFFFSGVYTAEGQRIGFIRIPSFSPASTTQQVNVFLAEMIFMQANTDGLIIDDMRNPGGNVCFVEDLTTLLTRDRIRGLSYEFRPDRNLINSYDSNIVAARALGFPTWVTDNWDWTLGELRSAYARGSRSAGIGLCQPDSESLLPIEVEGLGAVGYTKPVMVLTDEFSASSGDAFPAILQDNRRALIYGMRTMGLGGTVVNFSGTTYSEAVTRVTRSLMVRKAPIVAEGYPVAPYIENIGVQPDVVNDYMTRDNLINGGTTFVNQFTARMVQYIRTGR